MSGCLLSQANATICFARKTQTLIPGKHCAQDNWYTRLSNLTLSAHVQLFLHYIFNNWSYVSVKLQNNMYWPHYQVIGYTLNTE